MSRDDEHPFRPMSSSVVRIAAAWFNLPELYEIENKMPMPKGLLIGEQPRSEQNYKMPLWPWPSNCSGGRLYKLSGMPVKDYLLLLARTNICPIATTKWDPVAARERALWIMAGLPFDARVIACGAKARNALGIGEWYLPYEAYGYSHAPMVAIPHPSGRNLSYNERGPRESARYWIRWAAGLEQ